jgi:hypothetical protein
MLNDTDAASGVVTFGPLFYKLRNAAAPKKNKKETTQHTPTFYERYRAEEDKLVQILLLLEGPQLESN